MNKQAMWAIAKKDMSTIGANFQVWLPMLILPVIFGLVLPLILTLAMTYGDMSGSDAQQILQWVGRFPMPAGLTSVNAQAVYLAANYMLAPFFLIIPLMTSSVITADSFAGEKERGTLETLLFAPVDLMSLFTGKVLAAFLPSIGLSLATFVMSAIAVNAAGWKLFGAIFFPTLNWLPLMLLVIPLISLLTILLNVFISARVASFQAAYQMGGVLVIPVILLVLGQVSGFLMLGTAVLLILGAVLALADVLLLQLLLKKLNRATLFESQIR
jgi:ABC-2 type transport system permease protein